MTTAPHPDPLEDSAPTVELLETLQPILRRIMVERTLSPGKVGILRHVAVNERASAAELAAAVQVSPQAISLATRELEDLGLIQRIPDGTDRRRTWIHPTAAGRRRLAEETQAGRSWLYGVIRERLTPEERQTLADSIPVLRKLTAEPDSTPDSEPHRG